MPERPIKFCKRQVVALRNVEPNGVRFEMSFPVCALIPADPLFTILRRGCRHTITFSELDGLPLLQSLLDLYKAIREDVHTSEDRKVTIFVSALEVDSVCALRILQVQHKHHIIPLIMPTYLFCLGFACSPRTSILFSHSTAASNWISYPLQSHMQKVYQEAILKAIWICKTFLAQLNMNVFHISRSSFFWFTCVMQCFLFVELLECLQV